MNWQKIFSKCEYEIKKWSRKYKNADTREDRENHIQQYRKALAYLKSQLQTNVPSFYENIMRNLYERSYQEFQIMEKDIDNFKKVIVDTGGKTGGQGKKGKDEGEAMAEGLMDTIITDKPNVKWDDIAGLYEAKKSLNEALIMPIKYPNFFVGNVQPWKGILLYGPPGTGKTFLAKACATECESTFFSVSSSDLMSKYVGESEKLIKQLFKMANEKAPSIIFIDEIDSMCGNRSDNENQSSRRVKTEFLVQMQGLGNENQKVLVLGATNLPWALDPAVRRRFERRVYISLPDYDARAYLLRKKLEGLDENLSDEDIEIMAKKTGGFSGSDLEILARDAAFEPLRVAQNTNQFKVIKTKGEVKYMPIRKGEHWNGQIKQSRVYDLPHNSLILPSLTKGDLINALKKAKSSVSPGDLKQYEDWTKKFGVSD